jgi:hypothetical protein
MFARLNPSGRLLSGLHHDSFGSLDGRRAAYAHAFQTALYGSAAFSQGRVIGPSGLEASRPETRSGEGRFLGFRGNMIRNGDELVSHLLAAQKRR